MNVSFDASFNKALGKIKDKEALFKIKSVILNCESSKTLKEIKNLKKIKGYKSFFRIKTGEYRIGIEFNKPKNITFITVLHRKDIYKKFP